MNKEIENNTDNTENDTDNTDTENENIINKVIAKRLYFRERNRFHKFP